METSPELERLATEIRTKLSINPSYSIARMVNQVPGNGSLEEKIRILHNRVFAVAVAEKKKSPTGKEKSVSMQKPVKDVASMSRTELGFMVAAVLDALVQQGVQDLPSTSQMITTISTVLSKTHTVQGDLFKRWDEVEEIVDELIA